MYGYDQAEPGRDWITRGPHPKLTTFLMTCHWLGAAQLVEHRLVRDNVELYYWHRLDGRDLALGWTHEGTSHRYRATPPIRTTDIFGNDWNPAVLTEEPVLFWGNGGLAAVEQRFR